MQRRAFIRHSTLAVAAAAAPALTRAQAWPARPISWVYAYPAGGGGDPMARQLAQVVKDKLGQPIIIENRAGAAGTIGAAAVAKAAPDGYTFLFNVSQELVVAPWLYPRLPYDPATDFAPVCRVATLPLLLVATASAGIGSVAELVARAKAAPGTIAYASAGNGSLQHLAAELLQRQTGITLNHIPYKGVAEAVNDLLGGQVAIGFVGVSTALKHVQQGRLRALGLSTAQPLANMPEFKPLASSPLLHGFDMPQWFGLVAPAATPRPVVERMATELKAALAVEPVRAALVASGMTPAYLEPADYGRFITQQRELLGNIIRAANIRL